MSNLKNPKELYHKDGFPKQDQEGPALQNKMKPVPDCGEDTYKGSGKLTGRNALITGGDSGIGRAVAIAFAREGANVVKLENLIRDNIYYSTVTDFAKEIQAYP